MKDEDKTKILFLDIDGVVNCDSTTQRHRGFIGIDPYMAFLVGKIQLDTGCSVVLSSTWRLDEHSRKEVREQVVDFIDCTPKTWGTFPHFSSRGEEIKAWLDEHPEVQKYAILDDDTEDMELHDGHYFRTYWTEGITKEIAEKVTNYLGSI